MALEAPLRSSTGSYISGFSSHPEMASTDTPEPHTLRPPSVQRVSASLNLISPSDIVGPSPVTSNGTETTEIEDEETDEISHASIHHRPSPQLMMLKTNIPDQVRQNAGEEAISVIHAPESFRSWTSTESTAMPDASSGRSSPRNEPNPPPEGERGEERMTEYQANAGTASLPNPPLISTNIRPVRYSIETATPQAQNLKDIMSESARLRSSSTSSLEKIPEIEGETDNDADADEEYHDTTPFTPGRFAHGSEVLALKSALQECWTLCNTLANLSTIHRTRVFNSSGTPDAQERAWKSCWKLCQRLYDNRDEEMESFGIQRMNLDLCRDFCQSLFDVRQREDEMTDSVLRVSFELNNHLYSAQESLSLPPAFRERTLDFYITLCHRLMKQRADSGEESDSLLKSCWSLAEMLFSLRQNRRDGRAPDEELLGSAVQACWELCDIFREGWTSVRPDRNTPRPTQTTFFSTLAESTGGRESRNSNRSMISRRESLKGDARRVPPPQPVPETPVTEFEDTPVSPDREHPSAPNILVLGTTSEGSRGGRWSSSASNLSSYSQSSTRTSSTATTTAPEDVNVVRIKALILKAAMVLGFSRDTSSDGKAGMSSLQTFVKQLPAGAFGTLPAHTTLLQNFKNLVVGDTTLPRSPFLPSRGKRVSSVEMAKAVTIMSHRASQYNFLRDLFRFVFGFPLEESETRKNVSIVV